MRAGVAAAVAAALAVGACGKKDKGKDAGPAAPVAAAPRPIPACERYASALAASDDLVAQPELHDLLRDEAALVRAANRAPTDADRAELTLRCAAGLVDLGKIATDGFDGDAGAPLGGDVDAGVATAGTGPQCAEMLHAFDRLDACDDVPAAIRDNYRTSRTRMTDAWRVMGYADALAHTEDACGVAADAVAHELTKYSCP